MILVSSLLASSNSFAGVVDYSQQGVLKDKIISLFEEAFSYEAKVKEDSFRLNESVGVFGDKKYYDVYLVLEEDGLLGEKSQSKREFNCEVSVDDRFLSIENCNMKLHIYSKTPMNGNYIKTIYSKKGVLKDKIISLFEEAFGYEAKVKEDSFRLNESVGVFGDKKYYDVYLVLEEDGLLGEKSQSRREFNCGVSVDDRFLSIEDCNIKLHIYSNTQMDDDYIKIRIK